MPFNRMTATMDRKLILETPVILPTINCMIITLFYKSMLNLLEAFKDPFGVHTDALHVQTIFLETETTVVDFLTCPVPDSFQPLCNEVLHDETVSWNLKGGAA